MSAFNKNVIRTPDGIEDVVLVGRDRGGLFVLTHNQDGLATVWQEKSLPPEEVSRMRHADHQLVLKR